MKVTVFDTKSYDREYLSAAAPNSVEFTFHQHRLDASTAATAAGCRAVVVFVNDELDADCIAALVDHGVEMLALRCAGYNQVDLDAAAEHGLRVVRVPAYSPHAVAEHAVALLQTLNRKIHRAHNRVREQNFSLAGLVGIDLHQKSVAIIGAGAIGRATAEIFCGYGCQVTVCDPQADSDWAAGKGIEITDFDAAIEQADIVSLHLPLTKDTHHLIDADVLGRMKDSAFLINTSRGKLVDTKALLRALKAQRLRGVALDVYEEEEGIFFEDHSGHVLQDDDLSRLLTFPNVIITAHQAYLTDEALCQIAETTCENLVRFDTGEAAVAGTLVES